MQRTSAREGSLEAAPEKPGTRDPGTSSRNDGGDRIDPAALEGALAGCIHVRGPVVHLAAVDSTSTRALQAAQAGARTGVWSADEQTAGRGRGGHRWHSGSGDGVYTSVLMAPPLPARQALLLSLATGLAAQAAIRSCTGLEPDLRWPNDLLLGGLKCGGILVETAVEPAAASHDPRLRYAVVGIGINVHQEAFPPELQSLATSLELAARAQPGGGAGRPIRREELLAALLRNLDGEVAGLQETANGHVGAHRLLERFAASSTWVVGKQVSVPEDGGYTGATAGLNESGFLLVQDQAGTEHVVRSGGVRELPRQHDASNR